MELLFEFNLHLRSCGRVFSEILYIVVSHSIQSNDATKSKFIPFTFDYECYFFFVCLSSAVDILLKLEKYLFYSFNWKIRCKQIHQLHQYGFRMINNNIK